MGTQTVVSKPSFSFLFEIVNIYHRASRMFIYVHHYTSSGPGQGREVNRLADFDIGSFMKKLVLGIVLILVYVALLAPLNTSLTSWSANETTFGPIAKTVVPLLIGVGILLMYVFAFVPSTREKLGYK